MKISIIGTGNVGGALARGFARAGHQVILGARNAADERIVALARAVRAEIMAPAAATAAGDVIVLALPWSAAETAVKALGSLAGRIVIDCMNPLAMQNGKLGLDRGFTNSGAETLAGWAPGASLAGA